MRPLVVLVLVLIAAVALILTLQNSSDPAVPVIDPPNEAPVNPGGTQPVEPTTVQQPPETTRVAPADGAVGDGGMVNEVLPERPGKNSLYGLVTNENNQPLPGAKVELSRDPRMGQEVAFTWISPRPPSGPPIATMTDSKGQYRFAAVVPRRDYYLVVSHPDYAPVQEQMIVVGENGDFQGPNVILRQGSIVQGTVTDKAGNVVPGAVMWLDSAFYGGEGESPDRLIATSDAVGHFEFKNVYAVTKQLTCTAEGYGAQNKQPVNVVGSPGEKVTVDFVLEAGLPIAGRVIGSDGMGVAGALVVANNSAPNVSYRGQAETLEDGTFQILSLHPGTYNLTCTAKGYRQQKITRVVVGDMNVVIDMLKQACVNGRVVDSSGNPVTAFSASVRRLAPNQPAGFTIGAEDTGLGDSFTSAPDGNFQLCGLDPGTYAVLASSTTSAPTLSESFNVTADQPSVSVTVRLTRGGTIKGKVIGPTGAAVGGATVSTHDDSFDDDPGQSLFLDLIPTNVTSRRVVTNANGEFELRFLTPDNYQIRISHANFAEGKVRGIAVVEGQPTEIGAQTLQVGGTVKGTVIGPDGAPLARGFVHLESETSDKVYDVRTDNEGRYVFLHVRPGNFTLSATAQATASTNAFENITDMRNSQMQITVAEGTELQRDLSLGGG